MHIYIHIYIYTYQCIHPNKPVANPCPPMAPAATANGFKAAERAIVLKNDL
jgi:hypothetical protein